MVKAKAFTATGSRRQSDVTLNKSIFGLEPNHQLLELAYRSYLANRRIAGAKTLTRGEVRGGGKKPWRQKGTGRARVGSTRVPQWRSGGVVFGPTGQENHQLKVPIKMKRLALRQALSLKAADEKILLVDDFSQSGKVKATLELLGKLGANGRMVLVSDQMTTMIDRATRNIPMLKAVEVGYLNVFDVLNADHIVITQKALKAIEELTDSESQKVRQPADSEVTR